MARHDRSLDAAYFENMFRGDQDPWDLETSAYEAAKFDSTIAALEGRLYNRVFEIGCAGGTLTRKLAPATADLLAVDISATALARARRRCGDLPQVRFAEMAFPKETPHGSFDLIVLSEVAYYWDRADLALAASRLEQLLEPEGNLLLVHFTGETDYPTSGNDAVEALALALGCQMEVIRAETHDRYRLDLWRRR